MNVSETFVPKFSLITKLSRSSLLSVNTTVLPLDNLTEEPPVISKTSSLPFVKFRKVSSKDEREIKSVNDSDKVPSSRSSLKLSKSGGFSSGIKSPGNNAFPSVTAKTSTPNTSSIANACITRYDVILLIATCWLSRSLSRSCSPKTASIT